MSRTGHRGYKRKKTALKKSDGGDICHLCGQPINTDLKWPHPQSWSADHINPVSKGGHNLGQIKPAHLVCNQQRGNKDLKPIDNHLRDW